MGVEDLHAPCRPDKHRLWTSESLQKAIVAVEKGISIRRAAEMHGIPKSTLYDHISGSVDSVDSRPGPKQYLTKTEEDELAAFLVKCSEMGYPHTRQQILALVQQILNSKNIVAAVTITHGWWNRFRQRHPFITLRSAVPLSYVRAMAQDKGSIEKYFDYLEETLMENQILDDPASIFNCDETGVPLNAKPLKTVHKCGSKNATYVTGSGKTQISVLACCSATGYVLPPYIIFDRKTLNQDFTRGELPGTVYGLSKSGWMDTELFKEWFLFHFIKHAPSSRPLILMMDGHSSHYCPSMIRTAAKEGIILFTLPPNTTHLCQPLDKGPFAPLKVEWRKTVHNFLTSNPGRTVTRYDFCKLFSEAWCNSLTPKNIAAGFRTTGVYPFDRYAVLSKLKDASEESDLHKFIPDCHEDIKYIPLYSPRCIRQYTDHDNDTESDTSSANVCHMPVAKSRSYYLSKILATPKVDIIHRSKPKKSASGRVLTSRENMLLIEEKEMEKAKKKAHQEAKRRAREEKKKDSKKSK